MRQSAELKSALLSSLGHDLKTPLTAITEQAVGKASPWFILGVMLFAWAVLAIYIESSVMFVRGGVNRVVKEAMGGSMATLSVSALLIPRDQFAAVLAMGIIVYF